MKRFIEGEDRRQATLLPDSLEDDLRPCMDLIERRECPYVAHC